MNLHDSSNYPSHILYGTVLIAKHSPTSERRVDPNSRCCWGGNGQVMAGLKLVPDKPLPFWAADVRFSHSVRSIRSIGSGTASNTGARQVRGELQQATTVEEVNGIIGQALVMKISKLSMTPAEEIVPEKPLAACGLDFLVAIEMRNWLIGELEVDVPLLKLMNSPSLTALAVLISERSNLVGTSVQEANEG